MNKSKAVLGEDSSYWVDFLVGLVGLVYLFVCFWCFLFVCLCHWLSCSFPDSAESQKNELGMEDEKIGVILQFGS